eukprot:1151211-Pelagomonas_calceolata.AAC.2
MVKRCVHGESPVCMACVSASAQYYPLGSVAEYCEHVRAYMLSECYECGKQLTRCQGGLSKGVEKCLKMKQSTVKGHWKVPTDGNTGAPFNAHRWQHRGTFQCPKMATQGWGWEGGWSDGKEAGATRVQKA